MSKKQNVNLFKKITYYMHHKTRAWFKELTWNSWLHETIYHLTNEINEDRQNVFIKPEVLGC